MFRAVSQAVHDGLYRPYPTRQVCILTEHADQRAFRLTAIIDRVVAKALYLAVEWAGDRLQADCDHGFHAARGPLTLLCQLEHMIVQESRPVLAVDDVRNAFENVQLDQALGYYRTRTQDADLLRFIGLVLGGADGSGTVSIDQGNPMYRLTLSLLLSNYLDLHYAADQTKPRLLRYANNLVVACRDVDEGQQATDRIRQLLAAAGLHLKGEDGPPVDLREEGSEASVLGFRIALEAGRVKYSLGQDAWDNLSKHLVQAHKVDSPHQNAVETALRWISAHGPAFEGVPWSATGSRIETALANAGFPGSIYPERLEEAGRKAVQDWLFTRIRRQNQQM